MKKGPFKMKKFSGFGNAPLKKNTDLKDATVKRDKDGDLIFTTKSGETIKHTDLKDLLKKKTKK